MVNATHQTAVERVAFRLGEAAHRVGCSRRFLEKQIALGKLRCIRLSPRCVRIRHEDLTDYLERNSI
jgi:excisionase family DNA binding protein